MSGKYCCAKFREQVESGSFHYIEESFDDIKAGTYAINGCCGGCFVQTNCGYCPFCGKLVVKDKDENIS